MPTKFYLTNKLSEYTDTTFRGSWSNFTNVTRARNYMIDTNKYGTNPESLDFNVPKTVNPLKMGLYRGISRRLMPQTISGTVEMMSAAMQFGDFDTYNRLHIYILDTTAGDNAGTLFATLLDQYEETSVDSVEWPIVANATIQLKAPATLTPAVIPSDGRDYRLVVEFGGISYAVLAGGTNVGMRINLDPRNPDLTPKADITPSVSNGAEFFTFSDDILLKDFSLHSNHEIELAIDLGAFPISLPLGTIKNHPVWFKCSVASDCCISVLACTGDSTNCLISLFLELTSGNVGPPVASYVSTQNNRMLNFPMIPGKDLYIKLTAATATSITLTLTAEIAPLSPIQAGDIFVLCDDNDVNLYNPLIEGFFPAIWYSPTGQVRTLSGKFPGSELVSYLSTGLWGIVESFTSFFYIYDKIPSLALLHRIATPLTWGISSLGSDFQNFWILGYDPDFNDGDNITLIKVSSDGTIDPARWTLAHDDGGGNHNGQSSMGVSRDGAILYYNQAIAGGKVHRHDLVNNVGLTPFNSVPAGNLHEPEDIIVLADNTIVCIFSKGFTSSPNIDWIYHYAPDGTVLHTYNVLGTVNCHHITHESATSVDKVWAWSQTYNTPTTNRFQLIRLTDGVVLQEFTNPTFRFGIGPDNPTNDCGTTRYGATLSCPLGVMIGPPPDPGGIFKIVPNKRDDVGLKIPKPTFRTSLIP